MPVSNTASALGSNPAYGADGTWRRDFLEIARVFTEPVDSSDVGQPILKKNTHILGKIKMRVEYHLVMTNIANWKIPKINGGF